MTCTMIFCLPCERNSTSTLLTVSTILLLKVNSLSFTVICQSAKFYDLTKTFTKLFYQQAIDCTLLSVVPKLGDIVCQLKFSQWETLKV